MRQCAWIAVQNKSPAGWLRLSSVLESGQMVTSGKTRFTKLDATFKKRHPVRAWVTVSSSWCRGQSPPLFSQLSKRAPTGSLRQSAGDKQPEIKWPNYFLKSSPDFWGLARFSYFRSGQVLGHPFFPPVHPKGWHVGKGEGVPGGQVQSFKPRPIARFSDHWELLDELFPVLNFVQPKDSGANELRGKISHLATRVENHIVPEGDILWNCWGQGEFGSSPGDGKGPCTPCQEGGVVKGNFA